MKKKFLIILVVFVALHMNAGAQKKLKFSSLNYAGMLEGQSGTSFQLQTVNGFRYKTWFAGAGTGLDYYYYRSIPLFISVAKFLPSSKLPLYFNADAGINFPWDKTYFNGFQSSANTPSSLYWAGGLGYKFTFKKRSEGLLLNLGYSYKHIVQETETTFPCFNPPCPVSKDRYDYRLKRLSFKAGWMF